MFEPAPLLDIPEDPVPPGGEADWYGLRGRVNALLAPGVGVHPEFTGRENIYYGALMLGMDAAEIDAKMESIVEFAELGEYIDRPFRTYSSGIRYAV